MRSKGSHFTLGVWGLRVCFSTLRLCLQPFATVRSRPQPSAAVRNRPQPRNRPHEPYGRAYGKFWKTGHFWRLHMSRCFVSRGRHSTLDVSIITLRGRRSTLDVSCWVFLRIALSGLRQVATRCKFRGRRGTLWDVMNIVSVAGAMLLRHFQKVSCSFRGTCSTFETSIVILRGRRSTSDVSHCVLKAPHSTLTLRTLHSTLYTLYCTLYTLHFTVRTLHSTLYTPHSTFHTPHSTL